ncbi:MAG: cell envelope integrity protein TolA [Fibrobacteraceae bacterium]|nr:cell envelope integrity protein TolA [Fibrobacteraceae bacterium]
MKRVFLLSVMFAAVVNASQIKDVEFVCDAKKCQMVFKFASAKELPTFFQKYDAAGKKLTVGFSETDFALGEGAFAVDENSDWVRSMKVFKEQYRGMNFLKLEMTVGKNLSSDKNEIALEKSNFLLKLKGKSGKAWTLSKLYADRKKAADKQAALDKKAAEKAALEEKKRLAEEKKANALAEKKRLAEEKKAAEKAAKEEKKRLAEEKKAAEKAAAKNAKEEKKRLAEEKKAAEKAAKEEKKRLAEEKKAAEKAALEEEKRMAEAQKMLDKASKEGGAVSALLPNVNEMTVLIGSGMEQFRLVAGEKISIANVSEVDKASVITVALAGPPKSPIFKIGSGSMVKSVTWGSNGLKIQLNPGAKPAVVVQEGALILQTSENAIKRDGFLYWSARPNGIFVRDWMKGSADDSPNFANFVQNWEKGSKKLVSGAQTFHLRPVVRELIVVADEIELYAAPNENSQVLQRLVFGDRLSNLDLTGLYRKVQYGNRVGFVNKRSVGYIDELSSIQTERLKQVDKERGELTDSQNKPGSQLEDLYEDRVVYSSFGRRDPFVEIKGLVEEGINIDQVELVGIIWESEVPMAILAESKNPAVSYTLKEGDKILNGKVLKITQTDVLFLIQEFGVSRRYSMGLPDKFGGQK